MIGAQSGQTTVVAFRTSETALLRTQYQRRALRRVDRCTAPCKDRVGAQSSVSFGARSHRAVTPNSAHEKIHRFACRGEDYGTAFGGEDAAYRRALARLSTPAP
jgi:hypothetical protein